MSLLQPMIDKLFNSRNAVVVEASRDRDVLEVLAVGLFTIRDTPVVLGFAKGQGTPFEFTSEAIPDFRHRTDHMLPVVRPAENYCSYFRTGMTGDSKSADNIFTALLSGAFDANQVKLLEFEAVKTIYPVVDFHDMREAFDGVDKFMDDQGIFHFPKALIGLQYAEEYRSRGNMPGYREGVRIGLEFGNILMWCDNGNIWQVSRLPGDTIPRGLNVIGSARGYNEFLRWSREYNCQGWKIGAVLPMPYHVPKVSPRDEPKPATPQSDPSAVINSILQQLLNKEPGHVETATAILLDAAVKRHIQPPQPVDRSAEYEQLAGDTILEYSAGKSAPIIKALNEVKTLITAAFVKKSNAEQK